MNEPLQIDSFEKAPDYAANYLRTFFLGEPTSDEQFLMRFLAHEYARLEGKPLLLEIGCGPVVNHVLSATPHVSRIDMADYREDNLGEIRKWISRDPTAHSWHRFTRFALQAEGKDASESQIDAREEETRAKIHEIRTCDLRRPDPLGAPIQYPAVSCFYTTEQASRTREEWASVFSNLAGLVAGGGRLFCCAIGYTDHYVLYDATGRAHRYPVPRLEPDDFTQALERNGFDRAASVVKYQPLTGQESEGVYGVILVSAVKKDRLHRP